MAVITLHIKKEDIESTYYNKKDCAIARALDRAQLHGALHKGGNWIEYKDKMLFLPSLEAITERVKAMYEHAGRLVGGDGPDFIRKPLNTEEPQDFTAEIELSI